jgi:hypothetical protein
MSAPVPHYETYWLKQSPTASECHRGGRNDCGAITVIVKGTWIVKGPAQMPFSLQVHEACHAVQRSRGGPYSGPVAERECDAVTLRAASCPH